MTSALLIPVSEAEEARRIEVNGLASLQEAVGGNIEGIPYVEDDRVAVYGHDTAKYPYLDASSAQERGEVLAEIMNVRGTRLLGRGLFAGDFIVGAVVLCGFDPETGENTDLPTGFEARLGRRRALPEADQVERRPRHVAFRWRLRSEPLDEHRRQRGEEGSKEHFAVLSCGHDTAGVNYSSGTRHPNHFYAALHNESEEPSYGGAGKMVGTRLHSGLGIVSEETVRYSQQRFQAFVEMALERLRGLYGDCDPRVTRYFEVDGGGAL